jgi:hypothetical protein
MVVPEEIVCDHATIGMHRSGLKAVLHTQAARNAACMAWMSVVQVLLTYLTMFPETLYV